MHNHIQLGDNAPSFRSLALVRLHELVSMLMPDNPDH